MAVVTITVVMEHTVCVHIQEEGPKRNSYEWADCTCGWTTPFFGWGGSTSGGPSDAMDSGQKHLEAVRREASLGYFHVEVA